MRAVVTPGQVPSGFMPLLIGVALGQVSSGFMPLPIGVARGQSPPGFVPQAPAGLCPRATPMSNGMKPHLPQRRYGPQRSVSVASMDSV